MKGERALDWAMRIDAEAELADLQSIKPREIKLMKFCQGLKDDRLYEKSLRWTLKLGKKQKHSSGSTQLKNRP